MVAYTRYWTDTRVRREAEALVDRGDTVDIISLREEGEERIRMLNRVRVIQLPVNRYRGSNVVMYLAKYLQFFLAASFCLASLHLRKPYHIIQVHTMPDFMVFAAIIPKLLGAKVILDAHDPMPELYQTKFALPASHWLIRLITWTERRSVGFAHRAIAVHKPHLDTLVSHGNPADKFFILLNLPDPKVFSRRAKAGSLKGDGFKLIYHGTVTRRNGLRVALRALATVRQEIKGLKFQIVGDGDDIPHLIQLTKKLDLTDCVSFSEGLVPLEELVPIILESDVGIVPIVYDDFTKHTLPVKLLEYVALGIPVVSSRMESIEAYFDDSMIQYFKPGNPDDLAEKVLEVYRDPSKRQRLTANADRFNRDYSWEQQKRLYYRVIDDVSRRV
jgi:glycosyltransferase involved in cell wall biosynthesis